MAYINIQTDKNNNNARFIATTGYVIVPPLLRKAAMTLTMYDPIEEKKRNAIGLKLTEVGEYTLTVHAVCRTKRKKYLDGLHWTVRGTKEGVVFPDTWTVPSVNEQWIKSAISFLNLSPTSEIEILVWNDGHSIRDCLFLIDLRQN